MQGSIKATFRDYLRIIFQRKKFILVPVIGIASCFAIYSFCIADEVYKTGNSVMLLDSKTDKPIIDDLATTSPLAGRITRSVNRVTNRSGAIYLIAGIEYMSSTFPNSPIIQEKRLEVLNQKQGMLQFKMVQITRKISSLIDRMDDEDVYQRKATLGHTRRLIRIRNKYKSHCEALESKIARAREIVDRTNEQEKRYKELLEAHKADSDNADLRREYEAQRSQKITSQRRMEAYIRNFRSNLKISVAGKDVTATFESVDPQLCKDVVDEALFRIEYENRGFKLDEILKTEELLKEKVKEYQKLVVEKALELNEYERTNILFVTPSVSSRQDYIDKLSKAAISVAPDKPSSIYLEQYYTYFRRKEQAQQTIERLLAERDTVAAQLRDTPETIKKSVVQTESGQIKVYRNKLSDKKLEYLEMLEKNEPTHPHSIILANKIKNIEKMIADAADSMEIRAIETIRNPQHQKLTSELNDLDVKIASESKNLALINNNIESMEEEVGQVPQKLKEVVRLRSAYDEDCATLKDLQRRLSEAGITRQVEINSGPRFEKRDPTVIPLTPHKPNRRVLMLLGLVLGIAGAAMALFFVEYADRSIRSGNDIKRHLGLPLLGTVPYFFSRNGNVHVNRRITLKSAFSSVAAVLVAGVLVAAFAFDAGTSRMLDETLNRDRNFELRQAHEVFPTLPDGCEAKKEKSHGKPGSLKIIPGVYSADDDVDAPKISMNDGGGK